VGGEKKRRRRFPSRGEEGSRAGSAGVRGARCGQLDGGAGREGEDGGEVRAGPTCK
jgi:hypothetical protein